MIKLAWIKIALGPLLFLFITMMPVQGMSTDAMNTLAIAAWMVVWWITEAVPIPVTSLLPIVLFPLMGVSSVQEICTPYGNKYVFLFLGGFVIALALERWNLHKRIALSIISATGTGFRKIVLGFMLATAFLSMWISNTASTLMMLPIATSVIALLMKGEKEEQKLGSRFALVLTLSVAYAANVGGIATLVGTPPNASMAGIMAQQYGIEIGFIEWFRLGFPFALLMLFLCYYLLTRVILPLPKGKFAAAEVVIDEEKAKLGKWSKAQQRVGLVFGLTAAAWIFRSLLNQVFPHAQLDDTMIGISGAILLFIIPSGKKEKENAFLMRWEDTKSLPWGILLLFGGGLALASAFKQSGLIEHIAAHFSTWSELPVFVLLMIFALLALFLTELMSNLALVNIFIPVVAAIGVGLGLDELLLVVPVTIASSCAFMLPMATPPNAIVFASGYITIPQMVRTGVLLNVVAALLVAFLVYLYQYLDCL
jgi:sodium-dependent dicarboxylate transporter 2/3/5